VTAAAAPSASPISHFPSPPLTEADLSSLWEGQRFPAEALRTRDGLALRVIYRGRRVGGPGPDFRDAIIATGDELLQGDIELHVRASDFRRHGHQRDPAYDGVALHLVFHNDDGHDTELSSGRRAPVLALGDWLDLRPPAGRAGTQEIRRLLSQPPRWEEPCRSAVPRLGAAASSAALDRLGEIRFRARTALAARQLRDAEPDDLLWSWALEALGYGGQRELMSAVAGRLPWRALRPRLAGLRPAGRAAAATAALDASSLRVPLVLRPLRPGNRPEARLRGAAVLAVRFARPGIAEYLVPHLSRAAAGRPGSLIRALSVEDAIGRARAIEILTNAALPTLAAAGSETAEAAYRSLPLPARYGGVRHIHSALAGAVPLDARRQQGMLYLLKQYCTQGGCGKCPLS
jgi:hypothetical protein